MEQTKFKENFIGQNGLTLGTSPKNVGDWWNLKSCYEWFASRFLYIDDKETDMPHRFFFNEAQHYLQNMVSTYRNEFGGGQYLIYKARQEGISTWVTNRFAWRAMKGPGLRGMIIANEAAPSENLLRMVKLAYDGMTEQLALPLSLIHI